MRINRQCIRVLSFPGADPSIPQKEVDAGRLLTRRYRNRRIGEFLKELDFTEGRGTEFLKYGAYWRQMGRQSRCLSRMRGGLRFILKLRYTPNSW